MSFQCERSISNLKKNNSHDVSGSMLQSSICEDPRSGCLLISKAKRSTGKQLMTAAKKKIKKNCVTLHMTCEK